MQDRHKVRVRLSVCQPFPRQLEHLSSAFGVNVDLQTRVKQGQAIKQVTAQLVLGPNPTSHIHPMPDAQTSHTALQGAKSTGWQPQEKRDEGGSRMEVATEDRFPASRFYPKDHTLLQAT